MKTTYVYIHYVYILGNQLKGIIVYVFVVFIHHSNLVQVVYIYYIHVYMALGVRKANY